jgi:hypothetical protein
LTIVEFPGRVYLRNPDPKALLRGCEHTSRRRDATIFPRNQGFHYNGDAETCMLIGATLGQVMVELIEDD